MESPATYGPEDILRHLRAAEGFCQLGMWQDAWDELEEIAPEHRAMLPVVLMRLEILIALRHFESAAVLAESLIAKGVREKQAYLLGAYAVRRCRSLEEAEQLLLGGEEVLKDDALWHYNLTCYASVAGRIDEAKERLRRCFVLDPSCRSTALTDADLEPVWSLRPRSSPDSVGCW